MMPDIFIENGTKHKCPNCGSFYCVENDNEALYRNITFLYYKKDGTGLTTRCRACKHTIEIKS